MIWIAALCPCRLPIYLFSIVVEHADAAALVTVGASNEDYAPLCDRHSMNKTVVEEIEWLADETQPCPPCPNILFLRRGV